MAGEEAGLPRVDGPAWGVWPAMPLWALRNSPGTVLLSWWKVAGSTAGARTQVVSRRRLGTTTGYTELHMGGPTVFSVPQLCGDPAPAQRQSEPARDSEGALLPGSTTPACPEGPGQSLPPFPTCPPLPKPELLRRKGGSGEEREGHQDRSRETSRQEWVWSQRCFQPLQSCAVWPCMAYQPF